MLAADRAAPGERRGEDVVERGCRPAARVVVARRGDQQRVQVAVPGVRDGGDLHAVAGADRLDLGQHRRHLRAGHADVLGEHRAEPFQCRVGQPAGLEQRLRLDLVGGLLGPQRAGRRRTRRPWRPPPPRPTAPGVSTRASSSAAASASSPRCFHSSTACRQARSSSSRADGVRPRRVTRATASPGVHQGRERADDGARRAGQRRAQPQGHLGDHPEGALGADEQAGQVVAGDALGGPPAQPRPRCRSPAGPPTTARRPEHVVAGDAVLEAAQPAGVGGDVAADRRPRGAGRVRRVPQAVLGDGGLEVVVDDAGLHDGDQVVGVDLERPGPSATGRGRRSRRRRSRRRTARCPRRAARPARRARRRPRTTAADLGGVGAARTTATGAADLGPLGLVGAQPGHRGRIGEQVGAGQRPGQGGRLRGVHRGRHRLTVGALPGDRLHGGGRAVGPHHEARAAGAGLQPAGGVGPWA